MALGKKGWINESHSSHLCILIPFLCCTPIKNSIINRYELNAFCILSSFVKNQDEQGEIVKWAKGRREKWKKSQGLHKCPRRSQLSESLRTSSAAAGEVMNARNTNAVWRDFENRTHPDPPENTSRPRDPLTRLRLCGCAAHAMNVSISRVLSTSSECATRRCLSLQRGAEGKCSAVPSEDSTLKYIWSPMRSKKACARQQAKEHSHENAWKAAAFSPQCFSHAGWALKCALRNRPVDALGA